MAQALPWFPLVGTLLGLALVILDLALSIFFPLGIRAVGLLVFDALITGMLHLDGFVDCCDALLGTRSVERRLDILRDSRVGAYGALGGALLLIARFAALSTLVGPPRILALLVAPMLGRWGMVYAVARYPYARAIRGRRALPQPGRQPLCPGERLDARAVGVQRPGGWQPLADDSGDGRPRGTAARGGAIHTVRLAGVGGSSSRRRADRRHLRRGLRAGGAGGADPGAAAGWAGGAVGRGRVRVGKDQVSWPRTW